MHGPRQRQGALCEALLRALPDWFGIEQSILEYRDAVDGLPSLVAEMHGQPVGLLALRPTSGCAMDVYVLAVRREAHRRGVGRALVRRAEDTARAAGARLLHVKTLAPSDPDVHYAATRAFYEAVGFLPLEELPQVWGAENPCLIMVKPL